MRLITHPLPYGAAALAALLVVAGAAPARAETAADFYRGKTLTLDRRFSARRRLRHLRARAGAALWPLFAGAADGGGVQYARRGLAHGRQQIYAKYAPDGLALAMFASSVVMEPLIGNKAALFERRNSAGSVRCRRTLPIAESGSIPAAPTTFEEMLTKETIIGGGAPAAITYQHPMVLKNVLKANFKVIPGYKGTRDINLAMQRGEVNGTCGMFGSSVNSQFGAEVKDGRMKLFIQMGSRRSDQFGKIPSVFDYAKTDEDRAILQFHFGQLLLGRPLAGPPGIPADRLAVLRSALVATMKDPQFLAEATKAGLDIDPVSPQDVMALLKQFAAFSPAILEKSKDAMGR